jgi:hypothetical protein
MKKMKGKNRKPKEMRGGRTGPASSRSQTPSHLHGSNLNQHLLALLALLASLVPCHSQYSLDWWTVDGGGGTSTGGVYTVSGTIGQPDAGVMSGGNYSLTGGFWALYAVQTPGSPVLSITLTTTNTAMVSWPSPSTGYNLQQNNDLNTVDWVTPPEIVTDNGTLKYIIVNPPAGNRFYRLKN